VPVAHDSSGPAAINFTLAHPERATSLCILNSAYDDALPVLWPEMVELFANKKLDALSGAIAQSPQQFAWLLTWQQKGFRNALPASLQEHFDAVTAPLIANNFIQQPSSGPAFVQLAAHFFEELARNTARLPELKTIDVPVKVIWGELDPYITSDVAKDRVSHFRHGSLDLLPAGHWVQSDLPEQVAKAMLSEAWKTAGK
jgi:haloalkane dehalogenase